jgi:hypothetical protein
VAEEQKASKPEKFKWKRLSTSIVREMFRRAVEAAKLTALDPKRTNELMSKIGEWALGAKFGAKTGKRIVKAGNYLRRKLGLPVADGR